MNYDTKDLNNTLNIAKGIIFKKEKIIIVNKGVEVELSSKQLFGLLKKLQFYLESDERMIDKNGPHF
jgi:hypothetical protein